MSGFRISTQRFETSNTIACRSFSMAIKFRHGNLSLAAKFNWLQHRLSRRRGGEGLLVLLGDGGEEGVAGEEGDEAEQGQVPDSLEHVELQPEQQVQTENGAEANVESCNTIRGLNI